MPEKVGRPAATNPRNIRMCIRLTSNEKELIEKTAEELGISYTAAILDGIEAISKRRKPKNGK